MLLYKWNARGFIFFDLSRIIHELVVRIYIIFPSVVPVNNKYVLYKGRCEKLCF